MQGGARSGVLARKGVIGSRAPGGVGASGSAEEGRGAAGPQVTGERRTSRGAPGGSTRPTGARRKCGERRGRF